MHPDEFKNLLDLYVTGDLSEDDRMKLVEAFKNEHARKMIEAELGQSYYDQRFVDQSEIDEEREEKFIQTLRERIAQQSPVKRIPCSKNNTWLRFAAASVIVIIAGFVYFNNRQLKRETAQTVSASAEILPGRNGAILTLANGQTIILDSSSAGKSIQQGNTSLTLSGNGILYKNSNANTETVAFNTIQVPRGRQFFLTLSDGTKVWLNAASMLRYPASFIGNERQVEVSGEAYFEVAHNPSRPFIVKNGETSVQVLGTHFNVHAYDDEQESAVTLLEGSIKVLTAQKSVTIIPGEQARIDNDISILQNVDTEEVTAWKNGKFQFGETADIRTVMHQISNWYDVDIEYKGVITKHIGGTISRDVPLSQLLKVLQTTGVVSFRVNGRTIEVSPQ